MALDPQRPDLRDISHLAFQHPLDAQAREALEKIPLLPTLVKKLSGAFYERLMHIEHVSNNLRVSAEQYPSLYAKYVKLAQVLDVPQLPTLYVDTNPVINAYASGMKDYYIVLHSGLIDVMSDDELMAILGHELGHVKCNHMQYKTLAHMMNFVGANVLNLLLPGVGQWAALGVQLALLEWSRKAEFSCDRAGALATRKPEAMAGALAKLGGFSAKIGGETLNMTQVFAQADEYQEIGASSTYEKLLKLYVLMNLTHPHPIVRVAEITRWGEGDQYAGILRGEYKTNADAARDAQARASARQQPTPAQAAATLPPCPNCGAAVQQTWKACPACGEKLTVVATQ